MWFYPENKRGYEKSPAHRDNVRLTAKIIYMTFSTHADGDNVLPARDRVPGCRDRNCFDRDIILAVNLIPPERADGKQNDECQDEETD